jgi:hypothetical protein|tara:strand:+ start:311 stop:1240 length:930 start_codon:yes stop_codon:yes gene_type:complete
MVKIRADIKDGISHEVKKRITEIAEYNKLNLGVANDILPEAHPRYNIAPSEKVFEGINNQYIIMGRDRPRGVFSGYGGKGNSHCGSIDIVAGLSGMMARVVDKRGELVSTDKSPELDAARIYISQRTEIDKNFNLPEGMVGSPTPRSGIAIKADGVRIIARDGIKLVTGTDEYNSQGVKIDAISGIDLIAGGIDEDMQPLVKGNNLELALRDIIELVNDLNGIVLSMQKNYFQLLISLQAHTHISPPGVTGGPCSPAPLLAGQIINQYTKIVSSMGDLLTHQTNSVKASITYTYPFGDGYINSIYNHTN